ncbi:uncharacterized protein [Palaemon carinicauda]|uniref:uncharacterized protein n=1 Tax=Palaemon carinicauda TaxID=392227 RepID=UPI0035B6181A
MKTKSTFSDLTSKEKFARRWLPHGNALVSPGVSFNQEPLQENSFHVQVSPRKKSDHIPRETINRRGRSILIPIFEDVTYQQTVKTGFFLLIGTLALNIWANSKRPNIFKGPSYLEDASGFEVFCDPHSAFGRSNCNLKKKKKTWYGTPPRRSIASRGRNSISSGHDPKSFWIIPTGS